VGPARLWSIGLALVLAGFALAFAAALALVATAPSWGVGGCVVVLFIPVCFGVGPLAQPLLVATIALAIALVVVSLIAWRIAAKAAGRSS